MRRTGPSRVGVAEVAGVKLHPASREDRGQGELKRSRVRQQRLRFLARRRDPDLGRRQSDPFHPASVNTGALAAAAIARAANPILSIFALLGVAPVTVREITEGW